MLQRAWNSDPQSLPFAPYIKTHALITLIQKGLLYYDLEQSLLVITQINSFFFCGPYTEYGVYRMGAKSLLPSLVPALLKLEPPDGPKGVPMSKRLPQKRRLNQHLHRPNSWLPELVLWLMGSISAPMSRMEKKRMMA